MHKISQKFYEKVYRTEKAEVTTRSFFGSLYLKLRQFEYHRLDAVRDLLKGGLNYLDIGCGNGDLVFMAGSKYQHLFGLDIARTRLKVALRKQSHRKDKHKFKFLNSDADSDFPFPDSKFDAITMVATLEHFFDPYMVMKEAVRILKKDGQMVVQVPNLGFLPRRLAVLMGELPVTSEDDNGWDGGHLHYFTVESMKKLYTDYGFTENIVTCSGIFAKFRRWWVELLGADIIISGKKK